jgi:polyferredoxin
VLAGVYVLMGVHVAHWKLAGRTLVPLELNEVMYTLELGIVTAGFLFMVAACLATLVFGRFFCSWGCHILALEDLCAWLLARAGIRPKPVRSRVLLLVPPAAMFYMFIWPQLARLAAGGPAPRVRILGDAEGWASFMTSEFARNLPGPWITLLTFAVCGFAIVYVLGSRAFCAYICPYGALFAVADRFAPGRIIAAGDCSNCGACTAACQSRVRVHTELLKFGTVVNPACMKDLDCVSACPTGAVRYGFTRPPLLRSLFGFRRARVPYDFGWFEDLLMAAVFVAALAVFRGLYDTVPFFLAMAVAGILAYVAVLCLRLVRRAHVRLNNFHLKRGRLTPSGWGLVAFAILAGVFCAHSGVVRYHELLADRTIATINHPQGVHPDAEAGLIASATHHLNWCERWGLYRSVQLDRRMAWLHQFAGDARQAEVRWRRVLAREPNDLQGRLDLASALLAQGRTDEARDELFAATRTPAPTRTSDKELRAAAHAALAELLAGEGRVRAAVDQLQTALQLRPHMEAWRSGLAALRAQLSHVPDAP